jgi:hypothetical protein
MMSNNLGTTTGFRLVKRLRRNRTLQSVNIDRNSIPIDIANEIAEMIARNICI